MNFAALLIFAWVGSNSALAAPPSNDDCANVIPISGAGLISFDSTGATTIDPSPTICTNTYGSPGPEFAADIWYCWTAECSGDVTIDTCGGTTVDTKLAVYDGCDCPPVALLGCDDDACIYQSRVSFSAQTGQIYLIRIGTQPGLHGGVGTLRIACDAPIEPLVSRCYGDSNVAKPFPTCPPRSRWDALNSTREQYEVVDDFTPELDDWFLSTVCWSGTYVGLDGECERGLVDSFEVTYYADDCGGPGEIIAGPFSQEDLTMTVDGPYPTYESFPNGAREFEYSAEHPSLPVSAGVTYWIGITNSYDNGCAWFWETARTRNGHSIQNDFSAVSMEVVRSDMAFCFNIGYTSSHFCSPAPVNDDCADALPLAFDEVLFDTIGATTDGPANVPDNGPPPSACDFPLGDEQVHKDVWYELEAPCWGTLRIDLCDSSFDTKLSVYEGAVCPPAEQAVACNDDACGPDLSRQSQVTVPVAEGESYKIRVGGYASAWGKGSLHIEYTPPTRTMLSDFAVFTRCFTGPCDPPCNHPKTLDPCCLGQDFDSDGDIDLDDYVAFQLVLAGP